MVRPLPPALPALLDVVVFGILPPSLKDKTSSYSAKAASNKVSDLAISGCKSIEKGGGLEQNDFDGMF